MSIFQSGRAARNLYIGVSATGLLLSIWGYSWQLLPGTSLEEMPTRIGAIVLNALHLFLPRPDIIVDDCMPASVRLAAFLCGVSGFLAASLVWITVAGRSLSDIWTQLFQRGHVVVVGNGDFAARFATSLIRAKHSCVHAVDAVSSQLARTTYRLLLNLTPENLRNRTALHKSETVIIDMGSDTESMAKATAIVGAIEPADTVKSVAVRVTDPVLSDRFLDYLKDSYKTMPVNVAVFDENRILARHVLATRPLFQRARERQQARVHALIIGFGDLGEKLMEQVLLTSLAYDLATPRVTIVDRAASERKSEFCARRPRVLSNLPIDFFNFDLDRMPCVGDDLSDGAKALRAAETQDPFTMIYVALPDLSDVTRAALLLARLQKQFGILRAPISYRCKLMGKEGDVLEQKTAPGVGMDSGFLRMDLPEHDLVQTLLGLEDADAFAIRIHNAYRAGTNPSAAADKPWEDLSDSFRRASRRAGDHVDAKLATMGIRLPRGEALTQADRKKLEGINSLPDSAPLIQSLAKLEHDRWCVDRFLDGWAYGPEDDDIKHTRRTLVPFDQIRNETETVKKDIDQVRELIKVLLEG